MKPLWHLVRLVVMGAAVYWLLSLVSPDTRSSLFDLLIVIGLLLAFVGIRWAIAKATSGGLHFFGLWRIK